MIFVDTSAWIARVCPKDYYHRRARDWMLANASPLLTTDYVVDETLTWLRSHGENEAAYKLGDAFFDTDYATVHVLTPQQVRLAWVMFRTYRDKAWSFTDCSSFVLIEDLGIAEAFAFDHHFRQFGRVAVVP